MIMQASLPGICDKTGTTIYSIGYEGLTQTVFIRLLCENEVQRVIDVRKNPLSRKPGFSKRALEQILHDAGIEYVHMPDLGIPSSMRQELKTMLDYKKLFDRYESEILPQNRSALKEVIQLLKEKPSALLCFEEDPRCCHRNRLSDVIKRMEVDFNVKYIRR